MEKLIPFAFFLLLGILLTMIAAGFAILVPIVVLIIMTVAVLLIIADVVRNTYRAAKRKLAKARR